VRTHANHVDDTGIHDPALAETWCDGEQWGRTLRSTSIATITTT
jgi:hypothetical protein